MQTRSFRPAIYATIKSHDATTAVFKTSAISQLGHPSVDLTTKSRFARGPYTGRMRAAQLRAGNDLIQAQYGCRTHSERKASYE